MNASNRLNILEENQIDELYGHPQLSLEERQQYFSLSEEEHLEKDQFKLISGKILFILQLGYFKCRSLFFSLDKDLSSKDILYIIETFYPDFKIEDLRVSDRIRLFQQKIIADMFGYKILKTPGRKLFDKKAAYLAKIHSNPAYLFNELKNYLDNEKIFFLQKMIIYTILL